MLLFLSVYKWRFHFFWELIILLIILFVVLLLRKKSLKSSSRNLFFHLKYGIPVPPLKSRGCIFFLFWSNILHSSAEETMHHYTVNCKCVLIFIFFQMEVLYEFYPICVITKSLQCFSSCPADLFIITILKRIWRNQFINIKCNKK